MKKKHSQLPPPAFVDDFADYGNLLRPPADLSKRSRIDEEEVIEPNPKLYVICGPAGVGKTTLINFMKKELGVKQLRKTTTRPHRSLEEEVAGTTISIPKTDFEYRVRQKWMHFHYENNGFLYGIDDFDLKEAYLSGDVYLFDIIHVESAFKLRSQNPNFVEVILLLPFPGLVEKGLQNRLDELLTRPSPRFETFQDELKYLKATRTNIADTKGRIDRVARTHAYLSSFKPYADHIIEGLDYNANQEQVRKIIAGN